MTRRRGDVVLVAAEQSNCQPKWRRVIAAYLVVAKGRVIAWDFDEGCFPVGQDRFPTWEVDRGRVIGSRWAFETAMLCYRVVYPDPDAVGLYVGSIRELTAFFDGPRFAQGRRVTPVVEPPVRSRRIRV